MPRASPNCRAAGAAGSPAEKVEHALNIYPGRRASLDPYPLNVWAQVVRVAWMIGAKARIEAGREREQRRLVRELGRRLSEKSPESRPLDGTGKFRPAARTRKNCS